MSRNVPANPMIESLEDRAFCSVTPMAGDYTPATSTTTQATYVSGTSSKLPAVQTQSNLVVIAIIGVLIGM